MPFEPASEVLLPFTVLDLTRVRSGPTCVRQLADWGANVIKIEKPPEDKSEALGGPRDGPDFQNLHRNKRSMTLNLKSERGLEIFKELVKRADIVVENYRPAVKDRLGIGYDVLQEINPGIVLASISGFGQDGPYKDRPGFDQIAQGMGGLMSVTGEPGRGPMRVGIPVADLCAGLFCAQGILLALLERERSGKGQWVKTSLLQAQIFMLDFQAARWLVDGQVPGQAGNNHPTSIPTGVFETSDGHINIASSGGEMWERLKRVLNERALDDPDFADGAGRSKNRERVNRLINEHTRKMTSAEWIEKLNEAGIPCGEINSIDKVFSSPQVKHLKIAQDVVSQERGPTRLVGQPLTLSRTDSSIRVPPPLMGQHTGEILEWLGYDKDTAAEMKRAGDI
ncbi:acetyl-CoA:oxalate CoA-transferase [bacterium MnTg02]|nr:acetyl-CoA:oxalate CoA-transferase [bacterium MnTg02]